MQKLKVMPLRTQGAFGSCSGYSHSGRADPDPLQLALLSSVNFFPQLMQVTVNACMVALLQLALCEWW